MLQDSWSGRSALPQVCKILCFSAQVPDLIKACCHLYQMRRPRLSPSIPLLMSSFTQQLPPKLILGCSQEICSGGGGGAPQGSLNHSTALASSPRLNLGGILRYIETPSHLRAQHLCSCLVCSWPSFLFCWLALPLSRSYRVALLHDVSPPTHTHTSASFHKASVLLSQIRVGLGWILRWSLALQPSVFINCLSTVTITQQKQHKAGFVLARSLRTQSILVKTGVWGGWSQGHSGETDRGAQFAVSLSFSVPDPSSHSG